MSHSITILVLGKLKDKNLSEIENSYLKRIKSPKIKIHELKASAEDKYKEGQRVIEFIKSKSANPFCIILCEEGQNHTSISFSKWLYQKIALNKDVFFILGGAEGHSSEVLSFCDEKLSLSPLTFPHKIARILLVEQIYRGVCIKESHPYHN